MTQDLTVEARDTAMGSTLGQISPSPEFDELGKVHMVLFSLSEKYPDDHQLQAFLQLYAEPEQRELLLTDGGHAIQTMLCHQLILTNQIVVKFLQRALGEHDIVEASRRTKEAARLMSVFRQGVLALHKVRAGNEQRITVQHVNVSGGNAVVAANVTTGRTPPRAGGWEGN